MTTTTTFTVPFIDIFWGTGDSLRLARETDCLFQTPDGVFAWCPQGVPTECYPHPRLNLISRQKCHEALLRSFEINVMNATPRDVAISLHQRIDEEIGICDFVYLLVGDHPAFTTAFRPEGSDESRVPSASATGTSSDQSSAKSTYDPVEMLRLLQESPRTQGKVLLVILPPPDEPTEPGPINTIKDGMEITVDEIEAGLRNAMGSRTLLEFFAWLKNFSFSDLSPLPFIPVVREMRTIPDHVLYIPDVVGSAMIWNAKTKKYELP